MNCPTCEYTIEAADTTRCPRCGTDLSCSALDCASCNACSGSLRSLGDRLFGDGGD